MIVGVAIDARKLATFKRVLDEAGYAYTEHALTGGTLLLKVTAETATELVPVIRRAEKACRN
jgi:hypothetical protein